MDGEIDKENKVNPTSKKQMRELYNDFFREFREYLQEYMRDSVYELTISEIPIKGKVKLFDGYTAGKARIKNQGHSTCFLSTTGQGGYKLEPNESIEFFVNTQVIATTISGSTILGFVKT